MLKKNKSYKTSITELLTLLIPRSRVGTEPISLTPACSTGLFQHRARGLGPRKTEGYILSQSWPEVTDTEKMSTLTLVSSLEASQLSHLGPSRDS